MSGDELRALTRQRRQLTAAVTTRRAADRGARTGTRVTEAVADQVEATLTAAMVDEQLRPAPCAAGCWSRRWRPPASTRRTSRRAVAVPEALGFSAPSREAEPPARPDLHVVPDPEADAEGGRRRRARRSTRPRPTLAEADRGVRRGGRRRRGARGPQPADPGRDRRAASADRRAGVRRRGDRRRARRRRGRPRRGRGRPSRDGHPRPRRRRGGGGEAGGVVPDERALGRLRTDRQGLPRQTSARPSPSSARRVAPAGVGGVGGGPVGGGLEALVERPGVAQVVGGRPDPGAEAGEERRAEAVVSTTFGRSTGTPTWSAWSWQSRSLAAAPPSTRSDERRRHRLEHVAHLEGDRLQGGADDVRAGGAAGEADDQAAGVRVPVRGAEAGERRHEHHALAVGHGARRSPRSRRPSRRSGGRRAATARPRRSRRSSPRSA